MSHDSHSHATGEINHDTTEPNAKALVVWITGIMVFLVVIVAISFYYYFGVISSEQNKKEMMDTETSQVDPMTRAAWVDREKGLVRLPIDMAIQKTVQDYQR